MPVIIRVLDGRDKGGCGNTFVLVSLFEENFSKNIFVHFVGASQSV